MMSQIVYALFALCALAVARLVDGQSLPLAMNGQQQYTTSIEIGTPPSNITLLLSFNDTNLAVYANKRPPSSTYNMITLIGQTVLSSDYVIVAGLNKTEQIFLTISQAATSNANTDGVLGLGYAAQNDYNISSPLYNVLTKYPQDQQRFSIELQSTVNNTSALGDEVLLGELRDNFQIDQFMFVNNVNTSNWTFTVNELYFNSSTLAASNVSASFSLNLNGVAVPTAIFAKLSLQNDSTEFQLPCDDNSTLFAFTIATSNLTLSAMDFNIANNSGALCNISIQNSGNDNLILGTAFLTKYYTLFDAGHARIGFVDSSSGSANTSTTITETPPTTTNPSPNPPPSTKAPNSASVVFSWTTFAEVFGLFVISLMIR